MAKKRYKIRKEQLERVVESFVMEQAAPDARKHVKGSETKAERITANPPEKDLDEKKSQSPDAKKHIKQKMDGKMVEKSPNLKEPKKMSMKMKQASEAKKHKMSENIELTEEELNEFFGKKTPEEMTAKGQERVKKDKKANSIYRMVHSRFGKKASDKYLMYLGSLGMLSKGMISVNWDENLEAPDGTPGWFTERGKARGSGNPQGGAFAG